MYYSPIRENFYCFLIRVMLILRNDLRGVNIVKIFCMSTLLVFQCLFEAVTRNCTINKESRRKVCVP